MATANPPTIGDELEQQLLQAIREADEIPLPGARDLPILKGLTQKGAFSVPQENVIVQAVDILTKSGRVFVYGSTIVFEIGKLDGGGQHLAPLRTGSNVEPGAGDLLANVFVCEQGEIQFAPPKWFCDLVLGRAQQ